MAETASTAALTNFTDSTGSAASAWESTDASTSTSTSQEKKYSKVQVNFILDITKELLYFDPTITSENIDPVGNTETEKKIKNSTYALVSNKTSDSDILSKLQEGNKSSDGVIIITSIKKALGKDASKILKFMEASRAIDVFLTKNPNEGFKEDLQALKEFLDTDKQASSVENVILKNVFEKEKISNREDLQGTMNNRLKNLKESLTSLELTVDGVPTFNGRVYQNNDVGRVMFIRDLFIANKNSKKIMNSTVTSPVPSKGGYYTRKYKVSKKREQIQTRRSI
jgi:hypothetical protein